ncbi:hypothetical protein D3C73_1371280 [compost metagenome]
MTGHEDQAQQIITDILFNHGVIFLILLPHIHLPANFLVLAPKHPVSPEIVQRPSFCGRHEPCARVVRNPRLRPLLQSHDKRILRQILSDSDISNHPGKYGDDFCRFHSPDGVDRAMDGGRHH